jgi:excisionase family DNA binding protein
VQRISHAPAVPDPTDQPTLNLYPEVAAIMGLSRDSVYKAAAAGELPVIRIGRRIKVPTAALRKLLALD